MTTAAVVVGIMGAAVAFIHLLFYAVVSGPTTTENFVIHSSYIKKDGGNMVENMVDFSQKSTMFSTIFPPSSISEPHGTNIAQSCSVTIFFMEKF
jgi:hypothetical protein